LDAVGEVSKTQGMSAAKLPALLRRRTAVILFEGALIRVFKYCPLKELAEVANVLVSF
jgi:hypothetical protein